MGSASKPGPSRAWFILPSVLLFAALVLGGIGMASFLSFVRSDFRPYQPDSSISVSRGGFTLYAENGTQGLGDLRCTATGSAREVRLERPVGRSTLINGRGSFVAVASTPADLPPGPYVVSCESSSAGSDVPLYVGARVDVAALGRLVVFGVVAPLFLGFCSLVLFVVLAVLRYRSRRKVAVSPPAAT